MRQLPSYDLAAVDHNQLDYNLGDSSYDQPPTLLQSPIPDEPIIKSQSPIPDEPIIESQNHSGIQVAVEPQPLEPTVIRTLPNSAGIFRVYQYKLPSRDPDVCTNTPA